MKYNSNTLIKLTMDDKDLMKNLIYDRIFHQFFFLFFPFFLSIRYMVVVSC